VERLQAETEASRLLLNLAAAGQTDLLRTQLDNLELVLHRKEDETNSRIQADQDTELMPGDVVEVNLTIKAGGAGSARSGGPIAAVP
jgi:hypothetical protein